MFFFHTKSALAPATSHNKLIVFFSHNKSAPAPEALRERAHRHSGTASRAFFFFIFF